MFGARKKFVEFVEVVDNDFTDESMYYNQPSMFPHRSDKDVSVIPLTSAHQVMFLELVLTVSALFCRYCHLPRHHHLGSCRNLVQVCTVPKVRIRTSSHAHATGFFCFLFFTLRSLSEKSTNHCLFVRSVTAGALGFSVRGMGNSTPQLNRNLTQGTQLASHITPTTGIPTMSLHTPPSPSRCLFSN